MRKCGTFKVLYNHSSRQSANSLLLFINEVTRRRERSQNSLLHILDTHKTYQETVKLKINHPLLELRGCVGVTLTYYHTNL